MGFTVLSLFDGISCGRVALERAGIKVDKYFTSEIKNIAIKCSVANYPDIVRMGDVRKVSYKDGVLKWQDGEEEVEIDLLIGGSPCQDFSRAMRADKRVGFKGEKSSLFYEYYRILQEVKPRYFLLENVVMKKSDEVQMNRYLGVSAIYIDSGLVSGALRGRYYWTNIPGITLPEDRGVELKDILTSGYTDRHKARALLASDSKTYSNKQKMLRRYRQIGFTTIVWEKQGDDSSIRYLNQTELERCMTLPEGYTKVLTRDQAADVLGNGWTVDVIAHIFSFIPEKD